MEKLSIIVPVYKVEKYLDRCIESLIKQSYNKLEIILVDDGSPDNCPKKCDEWEKKDNRIKVIHKINGGLSDARNRGIESATGEYIAFVDSDDFIELDMYENMIDAMKRTDSEIAVCGRYIYNNSTCEKFIAHMSKYERVFESTRNVIGEVLCGGIIEEATWDKVYKRDLFSGIKFPIGEINEDIVTVPKLLEKANKVVCVNKPYYYYCYNPTSITHSAFSNQKLIVKTHMEDLSTYIMNKYPDLIKEVKMFKGRYAVSQLYSFYNDFNLKITYKEYYKYYLKNMRENFIELINSNTISFKKKIEISMMFIGVYGLFCKLKKLSKSK